ncbi:TPA: hypothetical protein EYP84_05620 [Candidatus Bipolaricaulota bacterium]|nr:hypothetical protein [Candidatus Bipolaricaulota bacterium]
MSRKEDALIPQELKYTKDHEWVKQEDGRVRVGITHHAQQELGGLRAGDVHRRERNR